MEYSPHTPEVSTESDDDDESERPSKKKRAGALGAYAVEPKAEAAKDKDEAKEPTVWEKLLSGDKRETKEEPDKLADEPEAEASAEAAPLEELSETEKQYAEAQLVAALETPTIPEAGEAADTEDIAAAEAAVENFRAKIVAEHKPSQQAYEEALREAEQPSDEAQEAAAEDAADDEPREFDEEPIVLGPNPAETEPADEEDEDQSTQSATAAQTAAGSGASGSGSGGSGGSGSAGAGSGGSAGSGTGSAGGSAGGGTPPRSPYYGPTPMPSGTGSAASRAPTPARASRGRLTPAEYYYANVEPAGSFLVGGILGYLIGRRRGRIKTERRLLPVQKKLEKQVQELHSELVAKENAIRKSVLEQRFAEKHGRKPTIEAAPTETTPETATATQRTAAPEAQRLHVAQPKPESIGRVVVAAEATTRRPGARPEQKPETSIPTEQDILTMDREQLLAISETIVVADSNLRQIYETHLLGERGLRRLVSEHLQGKDIKRSLRQELIERQIDFERDPILRDKATANQPAGGGKASSSFSQLLQKVNGESDRAESEQLAMLETQAEQQTKRRVAQKQKRRLADLTMIATIAVLIALVALLVLHTR